MTGGTGGPGGPGGTGGPGGPGGTGGPGGPGGGIPLTVNGGPYEAAPGSTVADLVAAWCRSPKGVAVALDGVVVPRSEWGTTTVAPGTTVELVTAAAGG